MLVNAKKDGAMFHIFAAVVTEVIKAVLESNRK